MCRSLDARKADSIRAARHLGPQGAGSGHATKRAAARFLACHRVGSCLYPHHIPVRDKRVPLPVFFELVVLQLTEADDIAGLQRAIALAVVEVHLFVAPGFRVALAWANCNHSASIEAFDRPLFPPPVVGL